MRHYSHYNHRKRRRQSRAQGLLIYKATLHRSLGQAQRCPRVGAQLPQPSVPTLWPSQFPPHAPWPQGGSRRISHLHSDLVTS